MNSPQTFPLLNGKLHLLDVPPRPSEDPLWLAAHVPLLPPGTRVLDAACGNGIAALALLVRQPHLHLTALDINPALTNLAERNARLNNLPLAAVTADLLANPSIGPFDAILCNPPYHAAERGHTTPNPAKRQAHTLPANHLTLWLQALTQLLTPTGTLHLILHATCEAELTAFASANHTLHLTPLQTHPTRPAKRLLATVQASPNPALTSHPPRHAFNPETRKQALFP